MFGRHTNTILAPLESYVDSNTFINRANKWKQLSAGQEIWVLNKNKKDIVKVEILNKSEETSNW